MTPDGEVGYGSLYCTALEEIYHEFESGELAKKIEGVKKLEFRPDPHGTDKNCNIGVNYDPEPISIFPPPSDSEETRARDEGGSSFITLSSGMTMFISFAGALSVLGAAALFARRRRAGVECSDENEDDVVYEDFDEENSTGAIHGEFTRVKITPSDPFADILSTYKTDDSFYEVPLSPDHMVDVTFSGAPAFEISDSMRNTGQDAN